MLSALSLPSVSSRTSYNLRSASFPRMLTHCADQLKELSRSHLKLRFKLGSETVVPRGRLGLFPFTDRFSLVASLPDLISVSSLPATPVFSSRDFYLFSHFPSPFRSRAILKAFPQSVASTVGVARGIYTRPPKLPGPFPSPVDTQHFEDITLYSCTLAHSQLPR